MTHFSNKNLQLSHISPKDDHKAVLKIIRESSRICRQYRVAITDGETAIHACRQNTASYSSGILVPLSGLAPFTSFAKAK